MKTSKIYKKINYSIIFLVVLSFTISCKNREKEATTAQTFIMPPVDSTNVNYVSNRMPLEPSRLIKLPVGAIEPHSWLKECLVRQSNGLMGNLGEISAWLQKDDNAWLSKDGKGAWGWEEVPYWLKGYADTGYILNDSSMIKEAQTWFDAVIAGQRKDGNFGPVNFSDRDGTQDFWANMIMLYCLQSYYEYSNDDRVIGMMTKYFKYQDSLPDDQLLSGTQYWQKLRGGDNLHSVLWLYNRTGDKFLLDLARKLHRTTSDWEKRDNTLDDIKGYKATRGDMQFPNWYGKLVDWHNVNIAQGFREPAQFYQVSHDSSDLKATYQDFDIVREHFGQVPGGMFGADENARPGYADPRQGIETCGMVEQMNSDEHLLRITGDPFWADHAENVAFNTFPAALMPDFKSLRYFTSPNMVLNDSKNHSPGIANGGPFLMMNPFSSRCCQHNHGQGWAYFAENLWMATPDNGLAAVLYASSTVNAKVANGQKVSIDNETNYPFEDDLNMTLKMDKDTKFPLYLRIPAWCTKASVALNGNAIDTEIKPNTYLRLNKVWKNGDKLVITFPKELKVQRWKKNENSASVDYGPLTFSLKIKEDYIKENSAKTAIGDSKWQKDADVDKWPSYEIKPGSAWNYGLVLNQENPVESFTIEHKKWPADNYPFTTESAPIVLKAKGKKIPNWTIDAYGLAGELKQSPVKTDQPEENISLIPMGAARLRISSFPVVGNGPDAQSWKKTE